MDYNNYVLGIPLPEPKHIDHDLDVTIFVKSPTPFVQFEQRLLEAGYKVVMTAGGAFNNYAVMRATGVEEDGAPDVKFTVFGPDFPSPEPLPEPDVRAQLAEAVRTEQDEQRESDLAEMQTETGS